MGQVSVHGVDGVLVLGGLPRVLAAPHVRHTHRPAQPT